MKKKNIFLVKLTVVTAMIGFFSPSVSVNADFQTKNGYSTVFPQFSISLLNTAEARSRRGGGRAHRTGGTSRSRNVNANRNVNRNVNVNHYYDGGRHYGYYHGRAIVAWSTALVIGSMVAAASMPTTCTTFVLNGITYKECGSAYYQPYYQGSTVVYKVVNSPY